MERFMTAFRKSQTAQLRYILLFWVLVTPTITIAFVQVSRNPDEHYPAAQLIMLIIVGGGAWLGLTLWAVSKIRGMVNFEKSGVYKKMAKNRDIRAFFSTIEDEMTDSSTIEYFAKSYKLTLFITPQWLILVSLNGSFIRKRDELVWVYETTATRTDYSGVNFSFSDGTTQGVSCGLVRKEIIAVLKGAIPDICYENNPEYKEKFKENPAFLYRNKE
jgi:hypothetical protein